MEINCFVRDDKDDDDCLDDNVSFTDTLAVVVIVIEVLMSVFTLVVVIVVETAMVMTMW